MGSRGARRRSQRSLRKKGSDLSFPRIISSVGLTTAIGTRTLLAIGVAYVALAGMSLAMASTITTRPFARAQQGSVCSYWVYSSTSVGLVIPSAAEPDKPGPAGNEVRDIARVFFTTADKQTEFAGWLTTAFDGRRAFTPAGVVSQLGAFPMSMTVQFTDESHLPLGAWLRELASYHSVFDPALQQLTVGEPASTHIERCFTAPWDGSPEQPND